MGVFDDEKAEALGKFLELSEQYYRYFQMYWYYRGVCEEKLGHSDRAIDAYKRYQELDSGLIKWNKTAASAAMNMTKLLMHKEGGNKETIYMQLQIIDDNTNINKEDWNLSYFAGLVYLYKFGDIPNAKRELRKAEEKLSRTYYDEWKKFKKKIENKNEISIPAADPDDKRNICGNSEFIGKLENTIPAAHNLYLCRLALNNAKISETGEKIKENGELIKEINNIINKETTSIFEGLNYFESIGDNSFLKKYLQEIASIRIAKENNTFSKDELIVILPFKCILLTETYPIMNFYDKQYNQCSTMPLYDEREKRILTLGQKVKLTYRINIKEIKDLEVKLILLRIPFGNDQTICIMFDTVDLFNENFINPFMFARGFIYNDKAYKLPGNIVAANIDDTFEKDTGWNPTQECSGWRVQSSGKKIRIIDNLDRVRLQFDNTDGKAIALKDKIWKDICEQLENENYWEEWLKKNPSISFSSENRHRVIHQLLHKTR